MIDNHIGKIFWHEPHDNYVKFGLQQYKLMGEKDIPYKGGRDIRYRCILVDQDSWMSYGPPLQIWLEESSLRLIFNKEEYERWELFD